MSVNHGESLLRAILEDPSSDTVRLVYADWLEENGETVRAEFIRVQIEAERLDDSGPRCDRYVDRQTCSCVECVRYRSNADKAYSLRHRERELLKQNAVDWIQNYLSAEQLVVESGQSVVVFSTMPPMSVQFKFHRGFVATVALTTADFLAHAAALFAAQPITEVKLVDREPAFVEREPGFNNWTWYNDESRPNRHTITRDIWLLIERGWFPTENDAHAALSRACVSYGRERAGLLPLRLLENK